MTTAKALVYFRDDYQTRIVADAGSAAIKAVPSEELFDMRQEICQSWDVRKQVTEL